MLSNRIFLGRNYIFSIECSGIYMNNIFTMRYTTVVNVGTELKTHIERLESIITNLVNQQFTDMTVL